MINALLGLIFTLNLGMSVAAVKMVAPHMAGMVVAGTMPSWLKRWGIAVLCLEGIVSMLSFLALIEGRDIYLLGMTYSMVLLGMYAFALANVYVFVIVLHKRLFARKRNGRAAK